MPPRPLEWRNTQSQSRGLHHVPNSFRLTPKKEGADKGNPSRTCSSHPPQSLPTSWGDTPPDSLYPIILGRAHMYSGPQHAPTPLPRLPANQQPGTGRPQQKYKANHKSLLPKDQHPGINQQQAGLTREDLTNNSLDIEHLLAANLEGDLSAARDLRTLGPIHDTSLTESTSSIDFLTNIHPELIPQV